MKVVQCLYSGLSGVADVAFNLISGDRDRIHDHSLLFIGVVPLVDSYRDWCERSDVRFRTVRSVPKQPWRTWPDIYRALQELKPDALIVHGGGPTMVPALAYARKTRCALLMVEHHPIGLRGAADWAFSRLGLLAGAQTVVLSDDYAAQFKARLKRWIRPGQMLVIPNGVDADLYRPSIAIRRAGADLLRIGMAARFSAAKRFDLVVEAARLIGARSEQRRWQFTLAGSGDTFDAVKQAAHALPAGIEISFPGMLPKEQLPDWYRDLDIYVHAAEEETLSMALLQAMSSGLPIAASDVAGINNLIGGDPPAGMLVPEQTAPAFAEALIRLADAPEVAEVLGRQARERVLGRYSQDAMFGAYDAVIRAAAQARKPA